MTRETAIALIEYQCLNTNGPYRGISTLGAPQRLDWVSGVRAGIQWLHFWQSEWWRAVSRYKYQLNFLMQHWERPKLDFYRCVDLICIGHQNSRSQSQPWRSQKKSARNRGCNTGNDPKWHCIVLQNYSFEIPDCCQLDKSSGVMVSSNALVASQVSGDMHGGATILTTMQIAV